MEDMWTDIHNLTIYDPRLSKRESYTHIKGSFIYINLDGEWREHTPSFKFLENRKDSKDLRLSVYVDSIDEYSARREPVIELVPKDTMEVILLNCVEDNIFLQEHELFQEIINKALDKLVEELRVKKNVLCFNKNRNYYFSKGNGVIITGNNRVVGKFAGFILNENGLQIRNATWIENKDLNSCFFEYNDTENNIRIQVNRNTRSFTVQNVISESNILANQTNPENFNIYFYNKFDLSYCFHRIKNSKPVGLDTGRVEDLDNKNIYIAKTKFEDRFLSIKEGKRVDLESKIYKDIINRRINSIKLKGGNNE